MEKVIARIFRFDPTADEKPRYETYEVPYEPDMRILDVLVYIQENQDHSLAFRYSCRRRRCGTCSVMANGKPVLSCMEGVEAEMTLEPLPNLPVVRDLVVDTREYEWQTRNIRPYLDRYQKSQGGPEKLNPEAFMPLRSLQTCIECYSCMSACTVIDIQHQDFSGPATLVQLARRALDPRDDSDRTHMAIELGGLEHCVSCYCCVSACPLNINVLEGAIEKLRGQCAEHSIGNWSHYNQTVLDIVRRDGLVNPLQLMRKNLKISDLLRNIFTGLQFLVKGKISLRNERLDRVEELEKLFEKTEVGK